LLIDKKCFLRQTLCAIAFESKQQNVHFIFHDKKEKALIRPEKRSENSQPVASKNKTEVIGNKSPSMSSSFTPGTV
jgi:hypothetical protein